MGLMHAVILGVIQGLTEFLPISSTAHLRIVPALLGWPDPGAAFTAVIQLGTLAAVLVYFRADLWVAATGWARSLRVGSKADSRDSRMGWAIFLGTLPIVAGGVLFKSSIENELRSLQVVAWSLIGMGLVMGVADRLAGTTREIGDVRARDGWWVGVWQALALIPGVSRSGSTISGAMFAGFDRAAAARFSFLLSVPSVFAAGVFSVKEHASQMSQEWVPVLVATSVSFIVGYAAIAFLLRYLQTHGLWPFVVYRLLLGALILGMLSQGTLQPNTGLPDGPGAAQAGRP